MCFGSMCRIMLRVWKGMGSDKKAATSQACQRATGKKYIETMYRSRFRKTWNLTNDALSM